MQSIRIFESEEGQKFLMIDTAGMRKRGKSIRIN